jgi:hypothetical protein
MNEEMAHDDRFRRMQGELPVNLVEFNLAKVWNSQWIMSCLRKEVAPLVKKKLVASDVLFDPQDLEHQALFYLTTYDPGTITQEVIVRAVDQQYLIVRERLLKFATKEELEYLFRGLRLFYPDLNMRYRLRLKWDKGRLFAVGEGRRFEVEFERVDDARKIELFTGVFHYIHQTRTNGDVFAFYFKGDRYPWALETTESSVFSRQYKRDALLAHGIHPDKAIELTRYYTLPGSPANSISVIDSLVAKFYKERGVQALFTRTMPAYSKTKSTTIAGGLNQPLCLSGLKHSFVKREIDGKECWEAVTKRWLDGQSGQYEVKETHEKFTLLPALDVYMLISRRSFEALPSVQEKEKVIWFD